MTHQVLKTLTDLISSLSIHIWGMADISGLHPLASEYPQALSILVSYSPGFRTYSDCGEPKPSEHSSIRDYKLWQQII